MPVTLTELYSYVIISQPGKDNRYSLAINYRFYRATQCGLGNLKMVG